MTDWIVNKWDWMIYRLAHHSIRRMCEREPAFAYLFELWIREWRSKHPIPDCIEHSTERFFEALISLNQTGESDNADANAR